MSGYSLQGIIRKNVAGVLTQFEKIGYCSENMANYSTHAYKGVRFEEILGENGYTKGVVRTNHAQGGIEVTKRNLDVAINGPGFIPVTSSSGEIFYTRDGSFALGRDGILMTTSGDIVGGGINIPAACEKIEIKKNGEVYSYKTLTSKPDYQGVIPVVTFQNPEGLKEVGDNKYKKTEISGEEQIEVDHQKIAQYSIERANVDLFDEVNSVMRINASMLASTTLMQSINDMYSKAIEIRD